MAGPTVGKSPFSRNPATRMAGRMAAPARGPAPSRWHCVEVSRAGRLRGAAHSWVPHPTRAPRPIFPSADRHGWRGPCAVGRRRMLEARESEGAVCDHAPYCHPPVRFLTHHQRASPRERRINHRAALGGLGPAPLVLGVERGDGVEVEELLARFDARTFKDADAARAVVALGAVDVALPPPPGVSRTKAGVLKPAVAPRTCFSRCCAVASEVRRSSTPGTMSCT